MGGIYRKHAFCAGKEFPYRPNDPNKQSQLDKHRDGTEDGMVAFLFVQALSFLRNGVFVTIVFNLQSVQGWHQADHLQTVAVGVKGDRKQDKFG